MFVSISISYLSTTLYTNCFYLFNHIQLYSISRKNYIKISFIVFIIVYFQIYF